jgi:uncharacterized repeat protein (TIGR01451 family)
MSILVRFTGGLAIVALFAFPAAASAQVTLPFVEGFEGTSGETYQANTIGLAGAPEWDYSNSLPEGRLRMAAGAGFYNSGSAAATMDRDPSGPTQINYLTLTLDMTNYTTADQVVLDFAIMNHGEESSPNDRVWVRGSAVDSFVEIGDLNLLDGSAGTYAQVNGLDITAALVGAGQTFGATLQIRFGQEDNFPANSVSVSDGYTFDDIEVRTIPTDQVAASAILSPTVNGCGLSASMIEVEVQNLGGNALSNIPVDVTVTGDATATLSGTVVGPVAWNGFGTALVGPVDLFSASSITVEVTTMLVGDTDPSDDTITETIALAPTEILVSAVAAVCPGSGATLTAPTEVGTNYTWWDDATAGTQFGTGDTVTSPAVPASGTSFWVERDGLSEDIGPVDNTFGGGASYTAFQDGLVFDATGAFILDTVTVYPTAAGDVVVNLKDSSGTLIATATVSVAGTGATVLPLGFIVPIGTDYTLDAIGTTTTGLYRNSAGASYPYASPSGNVSITGTINALASFYYFFYDWGISVGGCSDERTEVVVTTDASICTADLGVAKTGLDTLVAGEPATWTLAVENYGPDTATVVSLDDPTPVGLTFVSATGDCTGGFPCALADMALGGTTSIDVTFLVPADWDPTADLTNVATVAAFEPDAVAANDTSEYTSAVVQEADLQLAVTADPAPVFAGGVLTYTATITNAGPSDVAEVSMTSAFTEGFDDLIVTTGCAADPDGHPTCAVGAIASGATAVVTYELGLAPDRVAGTLTGTFVVSSTAVETLPGDEEVVVETAIEVASDLVVTLDDDIDPAQPGEPITYTLEITNNGPSNAAGIRAEVTLGDGGTVVAAPDGCTDGPTLVCGWDSLDSGTSVTVEIETTAPDVEGIHTTTATVTQNGVEAAPGDEEVSEETLVALVSDLVLTARLDPDTVVTGEMTTLVVNVASQGPSGVEDADLTFTLPEGVLLPEGTPCVAAQSEVSCPLDEIGSGASVDLTVDLDVIGEAGSVAITVTVTAGAADPNEDDNTVVLDLTIEAAGDDDDDDGGGGTDGCASCAGSVAGSSTPTVAWLLLGLIAVRRRR